MDGKTRYRLFLRLVIVFAICFLAGLDKIPAEAAVFLILAVLGESSGYIVNGAKNKINGR